MKFKIAICDDEQNQIDYMASIVASRSAHAGHNCEIRTFASAEAFCLNMKKISHLTFFCLILKWKI